MAVDFSIKNKLWQNVMERGSFDEMSYEGPYTGSVCIRMYRAAVFLVGYLEFGGIKKLGQGTEYYICGEIAEIHDEIVDLYEKHHISEFTRDKLFERLKCLKDLTRDYYTVYGPHRLYENGR